MTFVLDQTGNPHPRLLREALQLRISVIETWDWGAFCCYLGFMAGMCAATGESIEAMTSWLDSHEDATDKTERRHETAQTQGVRYADPLP